MSSYNTIFCCVILVIIVPDLIFKGVTHMILGVTEKILLEI